MGCSILLVDDSRIARQVMRKTLTLLFDADPPLIEEADGGTAAVSAISATRYDVVFLDLTMPDKSGYDVLAELSGKPHLPRFAVMSADIQPKAKERVMNLGATAFLHKPPNKDELRTFLIEQALLEVPRS